MKTLEDYKNTLKLVKLKVIKAKKVNEELSILRNQNYRLDFVFEKIGN